MTSASKCILGQQLHMPLLKALYVSMLEDCCRPCRWHRHDMLHTCLGNCRTWRPCLQTPLQCMIVQAIALSALTD